NRKPRYGHRFGKGSTLEFRATPTTSPRRFADAAVLWFTPSVPRLTIFPAFHATAYTAGAPVKGSISLFSDCPMTIPLSVIQYAQLDHAQSKHGMWDPTVAL